MQECISRIMELETMFSDNHYNGNGQTAFFIKEGRIPIMVSAPHAVNQFREGQVKWADKYTGGIAGYLHEVTGCHLICSSMFTKSDPNYDPPEENRYQDALEDYVKDHKIAVLLDLHGATKKREYAVEIGTAPEEDPQTGVVCETDPSLRGHQFIADLITDLFEKNLAKCSTDRRSVWKNRIFDAGSQNTVTKYISQNTSTACVQLEINGIYRDPENEQEFMAMVGSLKTLIEILAEIDWTKSEIAIPQI